MPGTPATSPNFGAPRYDNNVDPADFATQVNAVTDAFDAKAALKALLPPVGAQLPYVGTVDPPAIDGIAAWMIADGRDVNSVDYPELDALIGASAGVGAGRHAYNGGSAPAPGKFRLPNKQGRTSVGAGTATGARGATAKDRGIRGGEETHQLTTGEAAQKALTTDVDSPDHAHALQALPLTNWTATHYAYATGSGPAEIGLQNSTTSGALSRHAHAIPGSNAVNDHNNLSPYEVDGGYIIRVR